MLLNCRFSQHNIPGWYNINLITVRCQKVKDTDYKDGEMYSFQKTYQGYFNTPQVDGNGGFLVLLLLPQTFDGQSVPVCRKWAEIDCFPAIGSNCTE